MASKSTNRPSYKRFTIGSPGCLPIFYCSRRLIEGSKGISCPAGNCAPLVSEWGFFVFEIALHFAVIFIADHLSGNLDELVRCSRKRWLLLNTEGKNHQDKLALMSEMG